MSFSRSKRAAPARILPLVATAALARTARADSWGADWGALGGGQLLELPEVSGAGLAWLACLVLAAGLLRLARSESRQGTARQRRDV